MQAQGLAYQTFPGPHVPEPRRCGFGVRHVPHRPSASSFRRRAVFRRRSKMAAFWAKGRFRARGRKGRMLAGRGGAVCRRAWRRSRAKRLCTRGMCVQRTAPLIAMASWTAPGSRGAVMCALAPSPFHRAYAPLKSGSFSERKPIAVLGRTRVSLEARARVRQRRGRERSGLAADGAVAIGAARGPLRAAGFGTVAIRRRGGCGGDTG